MLRSVFLAVLALLLPLGVAAQPVAEVEVAEVPVAEAPAIRRLAGAWDLRVDGATIFRFAINAAADGEWTGQWQRPAIFNSDGNAFYNIRGGVQTSSSMTGIMFDDAVELAFDDPRPGAIPDIFRFRLTGGDSAEMIYVGTDLAPYMLVRANAADAIGPWDQARLYRRIVPGAAPAEAPAVAAVEAEAERAPVGAGDRAGDRAGDLAGDRAGRLVLPAIAFDLAGQSRGAARPAPQPVPEAAAPEPPPPAIEPVEAAAAEAEPPEANPDEQPRIGYDFLEGL